MPMRQPYGSSSPASSPATRIGVPPSHSVSLSVLRNLIVAALALLGAAADLGLEALEVEPLGVGVASSQCSSKASIISPGPERNASRSRQSGQRSSRSSGRCARLAGVLACAAGSRRCARSISSQLRRRRSRRRRRGRSGCGRRRRSRRGGRGARSMLMIGVIPLPALMKRSFSGSGSGSDEVALDAAEADDRPGLRLLDEVAARRRPRRRASA